MVLGGCGGLGWASWCGSNSFMRAGEPPALPLLLSASAHLGGHSASAQVHPNRRGSSQATNGRTTDPRPRPLGGRAIPSPRWNLGRLASADELATADELAPSQHDSLRGPWLADGLRGAPAIRSCVPAGRRRSHCCSRRQRLWEGIQLAALGVSGFGRAFSVRLGSHPTAEDRHRQQTAAPPSLGLGPSRAEQSPAPGGTWGDSRLPTNSRLASTTLSAVLGSLKGSVRSVILAPRRRQVGWRGRSPSLFFLGRLFGASSLVVQAPGLRSPSSARSGRRWRDVRCGVRGRQRRRQQGSGSWCRGSAPRHRAELWGNERGFGRGSVKPLVKARPARRTPS